MQVTLNDDSSFTVKLSSEEWEQLKEVQDLFRDCSEKFDESVSLEETMTEVIEAGFQWLDS